MFVFRINARDWCAGTNTNECPSGISGHRADSCRWREQCSGHPSSATGSLSTNAATGTATNTNAHKASAQKKAAKKKSSTKQAAKKKPSTQELHTIPLVAGQAVVIASNVNVRGQAKLNSEVITKVTKGQTVSVLEEVNLEEVPAPMNPPPGQKLFCQPGLTFG